MSCDCSCLVQGLVKLADFGVAAKLGELEEQHCDELHQNVVGTPYWMAPEASVPHTNTHAAAASVGAGVPAMSAATANCAAQQSSGFVSLAAVGLSVSSRLDAEPSC